MCGPPCLFHNDLVTWGPVTFDTFEKSAFMVCSTIIREIYILKIINFKCCTRWFFLTGLSKIFLLCQPVSKLRPKKLGVLELVLAKKGPKRNFQLGPVPILRIFYGTRTSSTRTSSYALFFFLLLRKILVGPVKKPPCT